MKIRQEHYDYMKEQLRDYYTIELYNKYKQHGLSDKRFVFDAIYQKEGLCRWLSDNKDEGVHIDHIGTALRKIIKETTGLKLKA